MGARCGLAVALLLGAVAAPLRAQDTAGPYDLILRNGRVVDGTGNPWYRADVAIRGDRIAAIGDLSEASAAREIDAAGRLVTPGFIDTHSHAGGGLASPGLSHARPLLAQGVTTVFVNPDGGGPVDIEAQRAALLADGLGVNAAPFISHGSVRRAVLGMDDRLADADEMNRMRALVQAGMEAGAWGLSSGPFYAPGSYSDTDELVELAKVVAPFGGAYQSHIRDESDYTIGVVAAVDEVITVAREAGIVGVWTHAKALGPPVWGFSMALLRRLEQARAEGVEVYADQYPYPASATGLTAALLPRWAQAGGTDSLLARLDRPDDLAAIREAVVDNLARRGGADRIQFRRFRSDVRIEGRTLDDVARERGLHPVDAAIELFRQGAPSIVSFNMHDDDLRAIMVHPLTMTASDGDLVPWQEGVPHPRSYAAFTRKLVTYVREEGVVGLEAAIRSMTSLPAQAYRMPDRGVLRVGAVADLAVFHLERLETRSEFTDPHHLSEGMEWVIVNGELAIDQGEFTGALAGRVLRRN
ncbi:D-aminoacylase [Gemmatimonadota bacterium Y43]|uniref:N-acyl-D-amino-acid deacylase family protein n=1 Tax=Gaopeijia maritima TaxID=3119007 RepID=UPI00327A0E20